jgi:hypothetical protein
MSGESVVLDLIGSVYDAAANPELWPIFLEKLADAIGSTSTATFFMIKSVPARISFRRFGRTLPGGASMPNIIPS